MATNGFGSGPYDRGQYDRSWTSDTLTFGVSASDIPTAAILGYASLTFKVSQVDAHTADGYIDDTLGLGLGSNIRASVGGRYFNSLTLGTDFTYSQQSAASIAESFTLKTSLEADPSASILIPESLVFKTSADYPTSAIVLIYQNVSLDSTFTHTPTAKVCINSSITLNSVDFTIPTSSTGIFRDVWTSVSVAPPVVVWTSATIGF